jgi:hypothetical protein
MKRLSGQHEIAVHRAYAVLKCNNQGFTMLKHELRAEDGILILHPLMALEVSDFTSLTKVVDAYLDRGGKLRCVLISGRSFPGWENLDGLIAHLKFIRDHHFRIEKVAIVADGLIARVLPSVARHFVHAQLEHFEEEGSAMRWLEGAPELDRPILDEERFS